MPSEFQNVGYKNILEMLKAVIKHDRYKNAIINYSRYNQYSKETERFILLTNLVTIAGEDAVLSSDIIEDDEKFVSESRLRKHILDNLMKGDTGYSREFDEFLSNFKYIDGHYSYKPNIKGKLLYSHIRNFLYDINVLTLTAGNSIYGLNIEFISDATEEATRKICSPISLSIINKIKKDIGNRAEAIVLEYEAMRLSKHRELVNKIEHVSTYNEGAGFDIISWELDSSVSEPIARYIEVKAVRVDDHKFYLSRNEYETAKQYGEQYCLYLLPREKYEFYVDDLVVIKDPINKIFDGQNWLSRVESYSFQSLS